MLSKIRIIIIILNVYVFQFSGFKIIFTVITETLSAKIVSVFYNKKVIGRKLLIFLKTEKAFACI